MKTRTDRDVIWWATGWLAGIAGAAVAALLGANAILAVCAFIVADYCGRRVLPAVVYREPALIWGAPGARRSSRL